MRQIISLLFLMTVIIMAGCGEAVHNREHIPDSVTSEDINYFRDERTKLCFAERAGYKMYSFTEVPCEKVEQWIKPAWKRERGMS